jgi:LPS sulfotransferase NodH
MSYPVCASPRSGTELLCRGLAATGVAGCPREYFLAEDPAKLPDWRFWEEGPYAAGACVAAPYRPAALRLRAHRRPGGPDRRERDRLARAVRRARADALRTPYQVVYEELSWAALQERP